MEEKSSDYNISIKQARSYLITHHHLDGVNRLQGKEGILSFINKVGCIQFDPLDQVGYNSHLVLQSRIKNYKTSDLNDLLYKDRELIDFWDKNMSIYHINDYPYFNSLKSETVTGDLANKVKRLISERGPVCSFDFDRTDKVSWWWGPTSMIRYTLERMYHSGELIIAFKKGSKKYYGLTTNHLPIYILELSKNNIIEEEFIRFIVHRRIRAVGMLHNKASDAFLGLKRIKSAKRNETFNYLYNQKKIIKVFVDGILIPFYISKEDEKTLQYVISNSFTGKKVSFIAPLDNLIWDRKIISEIFNFSYKWEVYTPAIERKYGYYVLPVLYGNNFVARVELKYLKKSKTLQINNWWWEDKSITTKIFKVNLDKTICDFLYYLQGETVEYNCFIV